MFVLLSMMLGDNLCFLVLLIRNITLRYVCCFGESSPEIAIRLE